ncbi:endothelin-converting enzyme 1-like [Dendronephthya gigantea]|uniref:endothelin-converting enzyme 1-like n=1 Tax=Dendronephthya gigantea TaxID=151771 RepID=UPI00106B1546|nr:endothelin-converting enzyme 1-like [Dendronephthya gigantea]
MRKAEDNFKKMISPKYQSDGRWKTCLGLTHQQFEYVASLLYVNENVPEEAVDTAKELFTEIKKEFLNGLNEQEWLDEKTRASARRKLIKMKEYVGYPRFIKDPSKLNKFYEDVKVDISQLLQNQLSSVRNSFIKKIQLFGKLFGDYKYTPLQILPVLATNTVYLGITNEISILAGVLRPPLYHKDALRALNYGSLGMLVGHEIAHALGDKGGQFDENGNMDQWWTKKSHENFVKRSKCFVQQYSKVKVFGEQVDGYSTLEENIADNGGLKYAYRAYQNFGKRYDNEAKLPALPFTDDQLFFISFAQAWCAKYSQDKIKLLTATVPTYSLDPVRVQVPLHNFPPFSKAFGCTPPKDTCAVW